MFYKLANEEEARQVSQAINGNKFKCENMRGLISRLVTEKSTNEAATYISSEKEI